MNFLIIYIFYYDGQIYNIGIHAGLINPDEEVFRFPSLLYSLRIKKSFSMFSRCIPKRLKLKYVYVPSYLDKIDKFFSDGGSTRLHS